jgi:thiosulfate dehydrogenase [quinone] large subunit
MEANNNGRLLPLFILRVAVGWLFLHEGLYKLFTPGWTAQYYLAQSEGPLQSFFQWVIESKILIAISNYGVVILLIATGLLLMIGFLERLASVTGMVLLVFFYLSYPPFGGISDVMAEGNYLIVDKNMIMFLVLWVIFKLRPGQHWGVDRLRHRD